MNTLLVPTRLMLKDCDIPDRYSPAFPPVVDRPVNCYDSGARSCADVLAPLVSMLGSSHAAMALLRSISQRDLPCLIQATEARTAERGPAPRAC